MLGTAILTKGMVIDELTESGQIGRAETEKHFILQETTFTKNFNFVSNGITAEVLQEGETYYVMWDGVEYPCVCKSLPRGERTYYYLGDIYTLYNGAYGGEETGEPFCYFDLRNADMSIKGQVLNAIDQGTHTASMYQKIETLHPIDPKFLPGVCLPVVELETAPVLTNNEENGAALTAEENAAVNAAVSTGLPIVINVKGMGLSSVFFSDGNQIGMSIPGMAIMLNRTEAGDEWRFWMQMFKVEPVT